MRVEFKVYFANGRRGRKKLETGESPAVKPENKPTRLPRITQLMALAIKFERLLHEGHIKSYADLARLAGVNLSQITRIMSLRNLAPSIQEAILALEPLKNGDREPIRIEEVLHFSSKLVW